jgi:predicted Rossmann fold flavoprotein
LIPVAAIECLILDLRNMIYDLAVIGGGAAGFYGAIQAAELRTAASIVIVEKTPKLLSKVKVSGGGRCNVTHHCFEHVELATHYPRGEKQLRQVFRIHNASDTVAWFQSKGVRLKTEDDGRMFPVTDDSQTIVDCLVKEALHHKIKIETGQPIVHVAFEGPAFRVDTAQGKTFFSKNILVAIGGHAKPEAYDWIGRLGHTIVPPIPSLFTFNASDTRFQDLMGISVPEAEVKIVGTKLKTAGPVLITHWGLSGPAVIRLSAWAAVRLAEVNYHFTALVSWIGSVAEEDVTRYLLEQKASKPKQKIFSHPLYSLPQRLWTKLCLLSEISEEKVWGEVPNKNINKLLEHLIRCQFHIKGKTTFKEEFVTCGGVDLNDVDLTTMQSKKVKGLFFAGEVLNIDGETGGFNFQAAWSTAYIAAKSCGAT